MEAVDLEAQQEERTVLEPGRVVGGYRVLRQIGAGAMAEIYEAEHESLGKRAAIKVMSQATQANPIARERFSREGRLAAKVAHPNVVEIYDVGFLDDVPYLIMEFLPGQDLDKLIQASEEPMGVRDALELVVPVAAAVAAGHDQDIVHRDLKPENIVIIDKGRRRVPKVLDFGVSRVLAPGDSVTQVNEVVGTPLYMSPEQARGEKPITAATDQYALAVILYQLLTGKTPHDGPSMLMVLTAVAYQPPVPITKRRSDLDPGFVAVLERAMSAKKEERFADLRGFACALLRFASPKLQAEWGDELGMDEADIPQNVQESTFPPPPLESDAPIGKLDIPQKKGADAVEAGASGVRRVDERSSPPSAPPLPSQSGHSGANKWIVVAAVVVVLLVVVWLATNL